MFKSIEEAAQNFCIHQIRSPYTLKDGINDKRTLIAYLDINTQENKKYRVYIIADEGFIQRVAKLYLEEDQSDEETLKDMMLETANLIVGSAKVLAQDDNDALEYTIETPHFEKIGSFDYEYDSAKTITVDNDDLTIAIKEIDA